MTTQLDFSVVANNNKSIYIQVLDENGDAINITGYSILWQARTAYGSPTLISKSTSAGSIAIIDGPGGIFGFVVLAADTQSIPQGWLIHEAITVDGSLNPVTITNDDPLLSYGNMYVRQQYTVQA